MVKDCWRFIGRMERESDCLDKKIDFILTWVDGSDPDWQRERQRFRTGNAGNGDTENRFRDWDLLRYWFRGTERWAPWVNHIYFVTCGQKPDWLDESHPKLRLVHHRDYIPENYLPTFNSNVIELWMHRLPGLEEQFVLFNDDMFLTAPVRPEDFFGDGLPCDSALLDLISASDPEDCLPYMLTNNFALINRKFRKSQVMRRNAGKFFTLRYGKDVMRNLLLGPFRYFSCFQDSHLPSSHLKSNFEKVWTEEGKRLEQCGSHRFRCREDLTHWLMKSWQICEGNFSVRSTKWGRHFELWEDKLDEICQSIENQKYRAVCLNDSKTDIEFDLIKAELRKSFEKILPGRSAFEKK